MDTKAPQQIAAWLASEERSMRWLSRRSGVAISTVTRWLAGEMIPSYENRQKLAEVTGLHIANEEAWR